MKTQVTFLGIILVMLFSCNNASNDTANSSVQIDSNQTIYFGGDIITMEGNAVEYVEAVVRENDKIVFVGTKAEAEKQYANAQQYNLEGKTMMPGFIEPHLHPMIAAVILSGDIIAPHDWNVPDGLKKGVGSHEEFIVRLKQSVAEKGKEGEVLFVWGYHQLWHGDINKQILSEVAPTIPVVILHRSFHEAYMNDVAIELFKLKEADFKGNPQVEWDRGHFFEAGWMALAPRIAPYLLNPDKYKKGLEDMTKLMHKNGITTIAEPGFPNVDFDMEYNLLKIEMDKKPNFQVYNILNGTFLTSKEGSIEHAEAFIAQAAADPKYATDNIHIRPKQVKLFADGAIYSLAMEMKGGYTDGFVGQWITPPDMFEKQMNYFWDKGYQIN
ncbi:MAG: amidohydrolase family protein, partial [Bacteroidales bacterium]|nr:amidohydrolase family protein [Bacteroidales bacterium]